MNNNDKFFFEGLAARGGTVPGAGPVPGPGTGNQPTPAQRQGYTVQTSFYAEAAWVDSNCASIIFFNSVDPVTGGKNLNVIGFVLAPGQALAVNGNTGEIDLTRYYISFTGSGAQGCNVIRRLYSQ